MHLQTGHHRLAPELHLQTTLHQRGQVRGRQTVLELEPQQLGHQILWQVQELGHRSHQILQLEQRVLLVQPILCFLP